VAKAVTRVAVAKAVDHAANGSLRLAAARS
jgi:hypothetical protein